MTSISTFPKFKRFLCAAAAVGLVASFTSPAYSQTVQAEMRYSLPRQPMETALLEISRLSGVQVIFSSETVRGKSSRLVSGAMSPRQALTQAVRGSGLVVIETSPRTFSIARQEASLNAPTVGGNSEQARLSAGDAAADDFLKAGAIETVIVTGTRTIGRTAFDSAVPVDSVTAADILSASAIGDLGEAIEALAPSANLPLLSAVGLADNVRALRLRGLYPDQVLVLVNGKRRHYTAALLTEGNYSAGTSPVDLNLLPVSSIKRIEILRDGAGAQYGSDAIAGVVNVILKDGTGGSEASLSYGANRTQFEPLGKEITDGETLQIAVDHVFELGSEGFVRAGASYRNRKPTNRSGLDQVAFFENTENVSIAKLAGQTNFASGNGEATEVSVYANLEVPVSWGQIYAFAVASTRDSSGTAFFRYPFGSSGLRDEDANTTKFPNGYLPQTDAENLDVSAVGGIKVGSEGRIWDISSRFARNQFDFGISNTLNPSLGSAGPTSFATAGFELQHVSLNADTVRTLPLKGFSSPLNLAFGAEFRSEQWKSTSGDPKSYEAGPIRTNNIGAQGAIVLRPQDEADLSREIYSAYLDLDADVTDRLLVGVAGRLEHYSDFGSSVSGKVSTRFKVNDMLNLRGSVGNSIRAPSLAQQGYGSTDQVFSSSGVQQLVDRRILPTSSPIAQALGAEPLKQETATNYTLGFAYRPIEGLTLSLDGYLVDVADRIQLSQQINSAPVRAFIQRTFNLTNIDRIQYFANLNETRTEGFDFVGTYTTKLGTGDLRLTAAYNYGTTRFTRNDPLPAKLAAIDPTINLFSINGLTVLDTQPLSRGIYSIDWDNSQWSLRASATRFGRISRASRDATKNRVHDYEGDWSLDLEASRTFNDKVTLTVGANNVFDAYPEQQFPADNYFGSLPYDFTAPLGYNGAYFYSKIAVKW